MAGANSRAVVAVEVFVEEDVIPEVFVFLEQHGITVEGAALGVGVSEEDMDQPLRNCRGDLGQIGHAARACRHLYLEIILEEEVEFL